MAVQGNLLDFITKQYVAGAGSANQPVGASKKTTDVSLGFASRAEVDSRVRKADLAIDSNVSASNAQALKTAAESQALNFDAPEVRQDLEAIFNSQNPYLKAEITRVMKRIAAPTTQLDQNTSISLPNITA